MGSFGAFHQGRALGSCLFLSQFYQGQGFHDTLQRFCVLKIFTVLFIFVTESLLRLVLCDVFEDVFEDFLKMLRYVCSICHI